MQNIQLDLDCVFVEKTLQRYIDHHNTGNAYWIGMLRRQTDILVLHTEQRLIDGGSFVHALLLHYAGHDFVACIFASQGKLEMYRLRPLPEFDEPTDSLVALAALLHVWGVADVPESTCKTRSINDRLILVCCCDDEQRVCQYAVARDGDRIVTVACLCARQALWHADAVDVIALLAIAIQQREVDGIAWADSIPALGGTLIKEPTSNNNPFARSDWLTVQLHERCYRVTIWQDTILAVLIEQQTN
ncbi:MAG: hypothetical protein ACFNUL_08535 [Cardiobacterium hominis]